MPNQTYATISELQARITLDGSPDTGIPEATLQQLLEQAGGEIEAHCRRDFWLHTNLYEPPLAGPGPCKETLIGRGTEFILLKAYPLISLISLKIDGGELSATERAALNLESYGRVWGRTFPRGARIEAEYAAGYETPPAAVKEACLRFASRKYRLARTRERVASGVRSETMEGYSVTFDPLNVDRDVAVLLKPLVRGRAAA